jgi:CheY-like chemotaxis protein
MPDHASPCQAPAIGTFPAVDFRLMARVLVIDDEELLRATLRETLEEAGYEVADEADGVAGVRAFRDARADLVITDIIMPKKDGIHTIWELKQLAPDVKIIAISGGVPGEPRSDLPLAEAYGASRSLQKPFSQQALLQTVAELLV